jgi:hypothetical protein
LDRLSAPTLIVVREFFGFRPSDFLVRGHADSNLRGVAPTEK